MTRPSWLTVALASAGGFLAGVLLVAILGGPKGTTRTTTDTRTVAKVRTVTDTKTETKTVTQSTPAPADPGPGGGGEQGNAGDGVPNVVGRRLDRADAELRAAGFSSEVDEFVLIASNWVVVGQDPPAGSDADPGTTVTLDVQRQ